MAGNIGISTFGNCVIADITFGHFVGEVGVWPGEDDVVSRVRAGDFDGEAVVKADADRTQILNCTLLNTTCSVAAVLIEGDDDLLLGCTVRGTTGPADVDTTSATNLRDVVESNSIEVQS
jgi:hypothetical protein